MIFICNYCIYTYVAKTLSIQTQIATFINIFDCISKLFFNYTYLYLQDIYIEKIDGLSLCNVIMTFLAAQQDTISIQLQDALGFLYKDAWVIYRDLHRDNIILA